MNTPLTRPDTDTVRRDYHAQLDHLVAEGWRFVDLVRAGASVHDAHAAIDRTTRAPLPPNGRLIPVPTPASGTGIVALVPSGDLARYCLDVHGAYLRACSLAQPVYRDATHVGTDHARVVDEVRPITARLLMPGLHQRAPHTGDPAVDARLAALYADSALTSAWSEDTDLVLLGSPLPGVHVPLGYNGKGGIAGVRHVDLTDLLAAPQLKGLPSI